MKLLLPVTACLIYLLYGCSAPANIRATTLVRAANDYITDCEDSFINKLDSENDLIIMASEYGPVSARNVFNIAVRKGGVWKGYFYEQASFARNYIPIIDSFPIAEAKNCDNILAFVLKHRIFKLPDQSGLPPCTGVAILDGGLLSLFIGIPGKIIGREFASTYFSNPYCPGPKRTAFIEAYQKLEELFPKTNH